MFIYSLETVLKFKRRVEETHKLALAELEGKCLHEHEVAERLRSALGKCGLVPTNGWDYQKMVEYWEQLLGEIDCCNQRIQELERQAQEKRGTVVQAAVDRKKIENHREKRLRSYCKAQARQEQMQLDQLGGISYLSKRRGGDDADKS